MNVSIFCIQFLPTIRRSSFTNGRSPQYVMKTFTAMPLAAAVDEDERRPDLVQVAAPVDDHEVLGRRLRLRLGLNPGLRLTGAAKRPLGDERCQGGHGGTLSLSG